jgi:uncharacterized protein YdhG (YjbR/CyaY superfamily)
LPKPNPPTTTVDEYIKSFPKDIARLLREMRSTIKKSAPNAVERISWQMPGYFQNGILLFYAAQKHHIGFYALPGAIKAFGKELKGYKTSKGTIQFPFDRPLPLGLITKITRFRVKENELKAKMKKAK